MAPVADWSFDGIWFDSADGPMHCVDEGRVTAGPVVLVHGNPTWGYLSV